MQIKYLFALVLSFIIFILSTWLIGLFCSTTNVFIPFVIYFLSIYAVLRVFLKVKLLSFINIKLDKKEMIVISLIFTLLTLCFSFTSRSISFNRVNLLTSIALLFLILIQVSVEEIIFRGFLLRVASDEYAFNLKLIIASALSSLIFMLLHTSNNEVVSRVGLERVITLACYIIPAVTFCLLDIMYKSLLPSIILHYINNLIQILIISTKGSTLSGYSLFIDNSGLNIYKVFIFTIFINFVIMIYALLKKRKYLF